MADKKVAGLQTPVTTGGEPFTSGYKSVSNYKPASTTQVQSRKLEFLVSLLPTKHLTLVRLKQLPMLSIKTLWGEMLQTLRLPNITSNMSSMLKLTQPHLVQVWMDC